MTCKDCLHYEPCKNGFLPFEFDEKVTCRSFANKAEWVHLPCKVGGRVYYLTGIHNTLIKPATIEEIILTETGIQDLFVSSDNCSFENSFDSFYLTQEEAEKALAERNKKK